MIKSDVYSNVICAQCKRKISDTKNYCDDLKSNEIRLMGQLQSSNSSSIEEHSQVNCTSDHQSEIPFIDPSQPVSVEKVKQEANERKSASCLKIMDVYTIGEIKTTEAEIGAIEDPSSDEWPEEPKKLPKKTKPADPEKLKVKRIRIRRPKGAPPLQPGRKRNYQDKELDIEIENLPDNDCKKVKCSRCSKEIFKKYYRQHVERIHLMVKNFFCDICGRKFYSSVAIEEHMNQHLNLKPIHCPFDCGAFFPSTTARKNHLKREHSEFSEIICEFCASTFKDKHRLKVKFYLLLNFDY